MEKERRTSLLQDVPVKDPRSPCKCDNIEELRKCARTEEVAIFNEFARNLELHDVPPLSLLITRRLSKNLSEYYSRRQLSVNAA